MSKIYDCFLWYSGYRRDETDKDTISAMMKRSKDRLGAWWWVMMITTIAFAACVLAFLIWLLFHIVYLGMASMCIWAIIGIIVGGLVILALLGWLVYHFRKEIWWLIRKLFIENTPLQGYVAHIPHGAFTVLAAIYVHWIIAVLFGGGFIIFEIVQQWNQKDKAHQDLAGWLLGMVLAGVGYWIWEMIHG